MSAAPAVVPNPADNDEVMAETAENSLEAAAQRLLNGEGEESLTSPLKRNRKAVCTLASNHHPNALHLGKRGYPHTPESVATGVRKTSESSREKNKNPHQLVHQVEIERNREMSRAVESCRELSGAVAARCSLREQRERAPAAHTVHSSQNGARPRAGKATARAIARSPALPGCTVLLHWWCHSCTKTVIYGHGH